MYVTHCFLKNLLHDIYTSARKRLYVKRVLKSFKCMYAYMKIEFGP